MAPARAAASKRAGLEKAEEPIPKPSETIEETETEVTRPLMAETAIQINAAPDLEEEETSGSLYLAQGTKEMAFNVPYADLQRPSYGPANPYKKPLKGSMLTSSDQKNTLTGHAEAHAISDLDFEAQRRSFHAFGYGLDPASIGQAQTKLVGQTEHALTYGVPDALSYLPSRNKQQVAALKEKRKRQDRGDASDLDHFKGPWAGFVGEGSAPEAKDLKDGDASDEEEEEEEEEEEDAAVQEAKKRKKTLGLSGDEKSIFHGASEKDYLGRSYLHVPQDQGIRLDRHPGDHECFLPKRIIHTWKGHGKGVNAIRFFPISGHLLLSASNDSTIKIWDVYNERKCLRTFLGHDKAVRDICFSRDGKRFLSASYDKYVKLWDTETGQCIRAFTNQHVPYCAKFNPDADKQHIFLTGTADKKVAQFDINTGEIVQEYNEHLGAVNTITFVDDNRRFITTSDDKTMRVWEYDIPVSIKLIADPAMHGIPSVTQHPNQKSIGCQSLDNQILLYNARDKFRLNSKKRFAGHVIGGYACQVNFSPDGKYVLSGDSAGNACFWDYKTSKLLKKMPVHRKVTIGAEWHPQEPSKVATASWDGTIQFLD